MLDTLALVSTLTVFSDIGPTRNFSVNFIIP